MLEHGDDAAALADQGVRIGGEAEIERLQIRRNALARLYAERMEPECRMTDPPPFEPRSNVASGAGREHRCGTSKAHRCRRQPLKERIAVPFRRDTAEEAEQQWPVAAIDASGSERLVEPAPVGPAQDRHVAEQRQ